jgi:hypothetical protein
MARVGRLAGALLAETGGSYFLVGTLKEPCAWSAAGFEKPVVEPHGLTLPFVRLQPSGPVSLSTPLLALDVEGEALATLLAERFIIQRTGLVSERLWRMVIGLTDEIEASALGTIDARWLGQLPPAIWQVVRDSALKCS